MLCHGFVRPRAACEVFVLFCQRARAGCRRGLLWDRPVAPARRCFVRRRCRGRCPGPASRSACDSPLIIWSPRCLRIPLPWDASQPFGVRVESCVFPYHGPPLAFCCLCRCLRIPLPWDASPPFGVCVESCAFPSHGPPLAFCCLCRCLRLPLPWAASPPFGVFVESCVFSSHRPPLDF